jgi:hypothetical protein
MAVGYTVSGVVGRDGAKTRCDAEKTGSFGAVCGAGIRV